MSDRVTANNYRVAGPDDPQCLTCVLKHGVPYMWCPQLGRQVGHLMTCDRHTTKEGA